MSHSWPPSELNTPSVLHRDSHFATVASTTIHAPASLVFSILLDTSAYPSWCTFVPRVTVTAQPSGVASDDKTLHLGTQFTFHVVMDASKPSKVQDTHLKVTDVSTPEKHSEYIPLETLESDASYEEDLNKVYRVAWNGNGGLFAGGLKTERFHEVIVRGENECEVRTWEVMGGVLARTVKWMYKETLNKKFVEWCEDLKKISEQKANDGQAT